MAYLVLALGAFLSVGGALSILYGYNIVEIERGWTAVIAGATSLTGGIVTIAIGLVLKTLLDFRETYKGTAAAPALPAQVEMPPNLGLPQVAPPEIRHAEPVVPMAPAVAQASLMTPELESGMLAAILSSHDDMADIEPAKIEPEKPEPIRSPHIDDLLQTQTETVLDPPDFRHQEAVAEVAPAPEVRPEPVRPRFKVNVKPPAAVVPEPVVEPDPPAMDDWLDRAFSALDNEVTPIPLRETRPTEPPREPEPIAPPQEHELVHVAETHEAKVTAEPHHEPETQQLPATMSAVIGRYEADGTSYIMYADGSIEAHSDIGVYRFNSMTELKAFIEGTT